MAGSIVCHIVIQYSNATVRVLALLVVAALLLILAISPSLFLQIAVRGGLLVGGIAAAYALGAESNETTAMEDSVVDSTA